MKIHWRSPKMGVRGPARQQEGCLARPLRRARHPEGSLAPPLGRARHPPGCLVALLGAPYGLYYPPGVKNLKREEFWIFTAASWRKPTKKKKPSPVGRFRRGDLLPEGEIIAIVFI